ncbi:MAG: DinB family protein [Candidatus Limnocylindria bacterium]
MPPPLEALGAIAAMPESALPHADFGDGRRVPVQFILYDLLRHEQALATGSRPGGRSEALRILDLAQAAYGELVGVLVGRADELLETARDGEWSLRDLLRHAIAVELRYAAQVEYAATRRDEDPLAIPDDRLPCDRLAPPEPDFADSRTGGLARVLELLGEARARSNGRLSSVPDAALGRPSFWGKLQMELRMRLQQTAAHLTEVVIQAEKCVDAGLEPERRRILRRCCMTRGSHESWSDQEARALLDARYRRLADA